MGYKIIFFKKSYGSRMSYKKNLKKNHTYGLNNLFFFKKNHPYGLKFFFKKKTIRISDPYGLKNNFF